MGSFMTTGAAPVVYPTLGKKFISVVGVSEVAIHKVYYALVYGVDNARYIDTITNEVQTTNNIRKGQLFRAHEAKIDKYKSIDVERDHWKTDDIIIFVVDVLDVNDLTCAKIVNVVSSVIRDTMVVITLFIGNVIPSVDVINNAHERVGKVLESIGNKRVSRIACSVRSEKEFSTLKKVLLDIEAVDIKAYENKPGFFNCPVRNNVDNVRSWETSV